MIRKDFEDSGFPINRKCPVMSYSDENRLFVSYDNCSLKKAMTEHNIVKCVGIWPGKYDTDIFILNVDSYKDIPAPPIRHKDIDWATEVNIYLDKDGNFEEVVWVESGTEKSTDDPALYEYIIKAGRKHRVVSK